MFEKIKNWALLILATLVAFIVALLLGKRSNWSKEKEEKVERQQKKVAEKEKVVKKAKKEMKLKKDQLEAVREKTDEILERKEAKGEEFEIDPDTADDIIFDAIYGHDQSDY